MHTSSYVRPPYYISYVLKFGKIRVGMAESVWAKGLRITSVELCGGIWYTSALKI